MRRAIVCLRERQSDMRPSNRLPSKAPAPNRRPRFPLGGLARFGHPFCAPPASPAAVGEAHRSVAGGKAAARAI
jgi:hypothetical protein